MSVKLVSITHPKMDGLSTAEELISYCARVSNPSNQMNIDSSSKLLSYLIKHKHWSPFEMVDMTVAIVTRRSIAAQILRHRSFSFQEFSQRYSTATDIQKIELRKQGNTNRQSSEDVVLDSSLLTLVENHMERGKELYHFLIEKGVARETARDVLPLATETTMYMKGSIRSWIHYLELRCSDDTQLEHRIIANNIKDIFTKNFPNISKTLSWV